MPSSKPRQWIARIDNQHNATPEKGSKYVKLYVAGSIITATECPNDKWEVYESEAENKKKMMDDLAEIGVLVDPLWTDDDLKNKHRMHLTDLQLNRVRTSDLMETMNNGS